MKCRREAFACSNTIKQVSSILNSLFPLLPNTLEQLELTLNYVQYLKGAYTSVILFYSKY
jgi:hypothetical protein